MHVIIIKSHGAEQIALCCSLSTQIEQLTKEKKEAPKDQQLDYTLQIQQAQTQQKQTQYDIATKKAEIEKYDESIKNATVNSTMIGVVKKINENQSADTADTAFMTIVATGDYRVKGTIDEQSFLNSGLAEGQAVIVGCRAILPAGAERGRQRQGGRTDAELTDDHCVF